MKPDYIPSNRLLKLIFFWILFAIRFRSFETDSYPMDSTLEFTGVTGKFTYTAQRKAPVEFIHYLNVLSDHIKAHFFGFN